MLRVLYILCFLLTSVNLLAQRQQQVRVRIVRANVLKHDDKIGKNTQSLNGNVLLQHERTYLHCDSAYMYNDSNVVICYGNVHVIQNDSIHLYGDHLTYLGNNNLAKMRKNVKANKGNTWLYTEYLDYDRKLDKAYFYNGGKVVNNQNTLTSINGLYYPNTNEVYFKDSVRGESPTYKLVSDTLKFNSQSEVAYLLGPTTIVNSDSTTLLSSYGWYDTKTDEATLTRDNTIFKTSYSLSGDHIFYKKATGVGITRGNMVLTDSTDNMILTSDYGFYNEKTQEALATIKAVAMQIYQRDTVFVHADTFRIVPLADTSRLVKAFHHVKFFRPDIQGRCDSLVFDFRDSIATMYKQPIVWAQGNQMTARLIKIYTRNQAIYKSELIDAAFAIQPEPDTSGFNQIKGKLLTGHIRNNDLYKIDVNGNGQTIYYPHDDEALIGINRAESSDMTIRIKERKITNITMRTVPHGNMNPPLLLGEEERKLKGFRWLEDYRPKCKDDIFKEMAIPEDKEAEEEIFEGYEFDI